jgi:hypothetical protein
MSSWQYIYTNHKIIKQAAEENRLLGREFGTSFNKSGMGKTASSPNICMVKSVCKV